MLNLLRTSELFSLTRLPNSLARSFPKIAVGPASHEHQYDEDTNGPHEHINENKGDVKETFGIIQRGSGMRSALRSEGRLFQLPTVPNIFKRFKSTFISEKGDQGIPKPPEFNPNILKDSAGNPEESKTFTYLMVGGAGITGAMAAKSTVMNFLSSLSASGDVLAMAQVEMDLSSIPEGKSVVIKWRGKPIFIRHRTPAEIEAAQNTDISKLRDPQADSDRVQKPEWLVMLGICTHLGCVPNADSGDYGGWYCPCQ